MSNRWKAALAALSVIAAVFIFVLLGWWVSGGSLGESPDEVRNREYRRLRGLVQDWPTLNAAERKAALPDLVQVWQFADEDLRWAATVILGHAGSEAVPYIVPALDDPDSSVRNDALWALGIMGDDARSAFEPVRARLQDENNFVRGTAIFAVRRLARDPGEVVPLLIALFADPDFDVRMLAGQTVAGFGKSAVGDLRRALKTESGDARRQALLTLGLIGADASPAVPDIVLLLRNEQAGLQDDAAETLAAIGPAALPALVEAMQQDQDPPLRKLTILAVGRLGKPAVPLLAKVLADKDPTVRMQAVTSLGRIGGDAVSVLITAARDSDAEVRAESARVLGTLNKNDPGVVPVLVRMLKDPVPAVRIRAEQSLASLRSDPETVLAEIGRLLEDMDADIRVYAVRYLVNLGPAAVPRLARLLKDGEGPIRDQANLVLRSIAADSKVLAAALLPLSSDDNETVRQHAVSLLWRCGPEAVPSLIEILKKDDSPQVRNAAVVALHQLPSNPKTIFPALVEALDDRSPVVRASAASSIGRFGTQALSSLQKAQRDPEPLVRQYAALSLVNLQSAPQQAVPLLVESLKDDNEKVRAAAASSLGHFGNAGLPHLVAALRDKDAGVWKAAVDALKAQAKQGPPKLLVRTLSTAISDPDYPVRRAAAHVLALCGPDAVDPLIVGLRDKDERVQWEAADSLGVFGPAGEKAMLPLAELYHASTSDKVRKASLRAMLFIADLAQHTDDPPLAVPRLITLLQSKIADTRWHSALILGVIGPAAKEAVPELTKAMQDEDPRVRQAAAVALGKQ